MLKRRFILENLKHGGRDRRGETHFIDARKLGTLQTRVLRVLTPGRYVGSEEQEQGDEPFAEKHPKRLAELEECFREGERSTTVVRERLGGLGNDS